MKLVLFLETSIFLCFGASNALRPRWMMWFLRRSSSFSSLVGGSSDYFVAYHDCFGSCWLSAVERLVKLRVERGGTRLLLMKSVCRPATGLKRAMELGRSRYCYWRTRCHRNGIFTRRWALGGRTGGCSDGAGRFLCCFLWCGFSSWPSSCGDCTRARRCAPTPFASSVGVAARSEGRRPFPPYPRGVALSMSPMCCCQNLS